MESVKKEVIEGIEKTLRQEFMSNIAKTQRRDSYEMMAEIFNNFDRNTEGKFMGSLEQRDPDSAERIRNLMFTFEDLIKIDSAGVQTIMRNLDKDRLALALKGASEAQMYVVSVAKELATKGDIIIAEANGEEQLVY